jgi:hypothetical protein
VNRAAVLVAVASLVAAAVAADHAGVFGVRTERSSDVVTVRIRVIDAASGESIEGAHAVCTRRGTRSACTQTPMSSGGELDLRMGVVVQRRRTWLFERARTLWLAQDGVVHVMLIHPDYERKTITFTAEQIARMAHTAAIARLDRAKGR